MRTAGAAVLLGLTGLALVLGFLIHGRAAAETVSRFPFTAAVQETMTDGAGAVHHYLERYAIRADGSKVMVRDSYDGEALGIRKVIDASKQTTTIIFPRVKTLITYYHREESLEIPQECAPVGEHDRLFGIDVYKMAGNWAGPSGGLQVTQWVAPALSCFPLRMMIGPDGHAATRSQETVSVVVGEPSPDLFRIPADYVERSPSEWQKEVAKVTGQGCLDCNEAVADAVYNKHRAP